ncbi:MAG TPA: hypothetical protein VIJ65_02110 [Acidobacteriaceae bacterium]
MLSWITYAREEEVSGRFQNGGLAPISEYQITLLPITYEDILAVEHLDAHHRDPFDRLMVAQAINRSLNLLTGAAEIPKYPVKTLW